MMYIPRSDLTVRPRCKGGKGTIYEEEESGFLCVIIGICDVAGYFKGEERVFEDREGNKFVGDGRAMYGTNIILNGCLGLCHYARRNVAMLSSE